MSGCIKYDTYDIRSRLLIPTPFRSYTGTPRTQSLFLETSKEDKQYVLYTLHTDTSDKYPCIQDLYIQEMDLGEYKFSVKYFQDWDHWQRIKSCKWFQGVHLRMKVALEAKIRGDAVQEMVKKVKDGTASQQTLKYLADKDYIPKSKVGRPTRTSIEQEVQRLAKEEKEYLDELQRITDHDPKIVKIGKHGN